MLDLGTIGRVQCQSVFSIVITEKGGAQQQLDFDEAEVNIGRLDDNELCLPKNNVSKHHARLLFKDQRYVIVDQQSTNGTYVNGRRISGPAVVRRGDKIYIGDFILVLGEGAGAQPTPSLSVGPPADPRAETQRRRPGSKAPDSRARPSPPPLPRTSTPPPARVSVTPPASQPRRGSSRSSPPPSAASEAKNPARRGGAHARSSSFPPLSAAGSTVPAPSLHSDRASMPPSGVVNPSIPPLPRIGQSEGLEGVDSAQAAALSGLTSPAVLAPNVRLQTALSMLLERLAPHLDIQRHEESAFPSEHQALLDALIDQLADEGMLADDIDPVALREATINEAVGLGPLERLLNNRQVREIVVDGPTCVHADLGGGLTRTSSFFSDDGAVRVIAGRLLYRAGQKLDATKPVHEAQLPGGGTLQLLLPPLSPRGPLMTVRCATRAQRNPESYVTDGALSMDMLALLRGCMQQRRNVLVLGTVGSGVSEWLMLLARLAPEHERIVTIEDAPNASLLNPQVVPLCRRALPGASLHELVHRATALRPDRLILDDLRLSEADSALAAAAASGGVSIGLHAPSPQVALSLLAHSAGQALGGNAGLATVLLGSALSLFIHVGSDPSGTRRLLSIQELQRNTAGLPELRPLFRFEGGSFVASFLAR
ncbi:MAG TPA: ATPase, T2SS/T4P/T4SS family [Polyangiales bacterium]|nr:ATPase, T2SS/T4P/T4SS family [Polyangiales bacterium]